MAEQEFPPGVEVIRVGDAQGRGGLYNMLFPGAFDRGAVLLPLLGLNPAACNQFRFRDAWVEKDGFGRFWVHVYTRVGGGYRADYEGVIEVLRANPLYERDADDSFDATYASFWFKVPEEVGPETVAVLEQIAVDPVDTAKRWRDAVKALR